MKTKLKRLFCLFLVILFAFPACKKAEAPEGGDEPPSDGEEPVVEVTADLSSYQQSTIEDIVREVTAEDTVRDKTYVVDDMKVETLIGVLDYIFDSDEIRGLLSTDLRQLADKLRGMLYSDKIINFAVQFLYPLVEEYFAKVWADLPERIEDLPVDTGIAVAKEAKVTVDLHIDPIEKSLAAIQFYLFPTTLADQLPEKYAAVAEKLRLATTHSEYNLETEEMTTPWKDAALYDAEGNLDLPWGVTDKESFVEALSAALYGVEPLLMALISNKACDNSGQIGNGEGKAAVVGGTVKLDLILDSIILNLTATPNAGYNNTVAPILEALGLTVPDGNTFQNLHDVAEKGLVGPIEDLIGKVIAAPVSVVLSALPNLAYLIESQMVVPLLSLLKTEINYSADANYSVKLGNITGTAEGVQKSEEPIKINVGEMLDFESMGVDLSSLNGLLGVAANALGLPLPPLNGGRLATLGQLVWRDTVRETYTYTGYEEGKAAYIEANRADVLLFLLEYVLDAIKDKALLEGILNKVSADTKLPELVYSIIDRVRANPEYAIAALVELIVPQSYTEPQGIQWKKVSGGSAAASLLYTPYWTQEKAVYMTDNLPSLIDNVLSVSGISIAGITASSLSGLLDGLVGFVCKAETLNTLAGKLSEALSGVALPTAVADLLKNKLGLDLGFWANYKASFADGDREAFKKAVAELLSPAQSLLTFLLSDQDLTIQLTGGANGTMVDFVRLQGFDAYSKAIVPLLEALGAQNLPSPDALKTDSAAVLSHLLDAIFSIVDGLKADPYHKLAVLLPNVLCFVLGGGLTGAVDHLLYPVNLILDVVRPIYDLDLNSLVEFDLRFEKSDPIALLMGLLNDVIYKYVGVRANLNFTTASLFNALNTGTVEAYTSANGREAYRVNEASINKPDMLTVVYDYLLKELFFSDNTPAYLNFAKEKLGLSDSVYGYVEKIVPALREADQNYPGSGKALIFWVFYAAESVVGAMGSGGSDVLSIITALMGSGSSEKRAFARSELQKDITNEGFRSALGTVLKPLFS